MSANHTYRYLLETAMLTPAEVSPRGMLTKEMIGFQTVTQLTQPIVTIPCRGLDYAFMAAEAFWILSGWRDIVGINGALYSNLKKYSDDGITMSGAYGPAFLEQVRYVSDTLLADPDTRQAVMTIWNRNPRPSKDIPCTISLQFLIRQGHLHCIAHMRSSDCWLGWPYDVFTFTMMTCYVHRYMCSTLPLGQLRIMTGSQHIYARHWDCASALIRTSSMNDGDIKPIDTHGFNTPDELRAILRSAMECPSAKVLSQLEQHLCHSW